MPYFEINLAIDALLITILALALLPKYPKLTLCVFALYLIPWFLPLPNDKAELSRLVAFWQDALSHVRQKDPGPAPSNSGEPPSFSPGDRPQDSLQKTQQLYQGIMNSIAGATGTSAPRLGSPDSIPDNPYGIGTGAGTAALQKMKINADALWFYIRIFWIAGAFALWVQKANLGILALIPSLVPVVYLFRALPIAYEWARKNPWSEKIGQAFTDEKAGAALIADHLILIAAVMVACPVFIVVLLIWRRLAIERTRRIEKFLKPDLYLIRIHEQLIDFVPGEGEIVVEGMRFPYHRLKQDRKRPEIWQAGSGTVLEFVPRQASPE